MEGDEYRNALSMLYTQQNWFKARAVKELCAVRPDISVEDNCS